MKNREQKKMKLKTVGVQLPVALYEHLQRIAELQSMVSGEKLKLSSLIRTALISHFKFGKINWSCDPLNNVLGDATLEQGRIKHARIKRVDSASQTENSTDTKTVDVIAS